MPRVEIAITDRLLDELNEALLFEESHEPHELREGWDLEISPLLPGDGWVVVWRG
jgi:hypothetical protein